MRLVFPFAEFWWVYVAFTAFVLVLLALDLGVFHRRAHVVSFRESLGWSIVWVALALAFNYGFYLLRDVGRRPGGRAAGGAGVPHWLYRREVARRRQHLRLRAGLQLLRASRPIHQHRVLFYGVLGALVFRAAFIAVGAVLMQYHVVVLLFGAFLLVTGIKLLWSPEHEDRPRAQPAHSAVSSPRAGHP